MEYFWGKKAEAVKKGGMGEVRVKVGSKSPFVIGRLKLSQLRLTATMYACQVAWALPTWLRRC